MSEKKTVLLLVLILLGIGPIVSTGEVLKDDFRVSEDVRYTIRNSPQAMFDLQGNFVVVWSDYDYSPSDYALCFLHRFDSLGNKQGPMVLFSDSTDGFRAGSPSVAVRRDGSFVVTWTSIVEVMNGLKDKNIWFQIYNSSGLPTSSAIQVDVDRPSILDDQTAYDSKSTVAMDSSGNFVIVWETRDTPVGHGVWGQLFDSSGQRIGDNFRISTPTGSQSDFLSVAQKPSVNMKADGSFIASWFGIANLEGNGDPTAPVARAYNADGSPNNRNGQFN